MTVETALQRMTSVWKAGPSIEVVQTPADLYANAPADVRGAYFPNSKRAVLVNQNLLAQAVAETAAHEVIGHHGVRQLLQLRAWRSLMVAIQAGADGRDERLEAVRDYVRCVYRDGDGKNYLARTCEADEVMAAFAEALVDHRTGRLAPRRPWLSLWRAVRGHAAREILLRDEPASFAEVQGVLLLAEHKLRHGGLFWGLTRRWYRHAMEKPMGAKVPPRNLEESEDLLAADQSRRDTKTGFVFGLQSVGAIVLMLASAAAVVIGLLQVSGFIVR